MGIKRRRVLVSRRDRENAKRTSIGKPLFENIVKKTKKILFMMAPLTSEFS